MKKHLLIMAALILLQAMFLDSLNAQVTGSADVPRIISYQGQLTNSNGIAMNGIHHITATFYLDRLGLRPLWQGNYDAEITNGEFVVLLGSGQYPFPKSEDMDKPLWIGITIDNGDDMKPLTQLSASPYAFNVPDKSITQAKLSDDLLQTIMNGSGNHTPTIQGYGTNWSLDGNSGLAAGTPILGTTSVTTQKNWEIQVNSKSIWHFEDPGGDPNIRADNSSITGNGSIIFPVNTGGGFPDNQITGDYDIIAGGSGGHAILTSDACGIFSGTNNEIMPFCDHSFIGGGEINDIDSNAPYSVIAGGDHNTIWADHGFIGGGANGVGGSYGAVAGGEVNIVYTGSNYSFIGGGSNNYTYSTYDNISGGRLNVIDTVSSYSFIGGGALNKIKSPQGVIGGGDSNLISPNANNSVISGGRRNQDSAFFSTISGGEANSIDPNSEHSSIGGGFGNEILSPRSVISGGDTNQIFAGSAYSTIGGGRFNFSVGTFNFVGGGYFNGSVNPGSSYNTNGGGIDNNIFFDTACSIVGGRQNQIYQNSHYGCVGGGLLNLIDTSAPYSFIGGGQFNIVKSAYDVIAGGDSNLIDVGVFPSRYNFIGGGLQNTVEQGCDWNVVCGGKTNHQGGAISFIGGGESNHIFDDCLYGVITGGRKNYIGNETHQPAGQAENLSFIGGGDTNTINSKWGMIGGGLFNHIATNSNFSTIGGGDSNTISFNSERATITGGCHHIIDTNSIYSFIGGGCSNFIYDTLATIAGGSDNKILGLGGFIGGGSFNTIDAIDGLTHASDTESKYAVIGGGELNSITKVPLSAFATPPASLPTTYMMPHMATLGGGYYDSACGHYSSVLGGYKNAAYGFASAIPGGLQLRAGDWQTVVGFFNAEFKSINNTNLSSTTLPAAADPIFIVGNGTADNARTNAFEIWNQGNSVVFHPNGTGDPSALGVPSVIGATYSDNTLNAWAHWTEVGGGSVVSDVGVKAINKVGGAYTVFLNLKKPDGTIISISNPPQDLCITVTLCKDTTGDTCGIPQVILPNPLDNSFQIEILDPTNSCGRMDHSFMLHVTGRY